MASGTLPGSTFFFVLANSSRLATPSSRCKFPFVELFCASDLSFF